ncbi:MAG TPA: YgcG family protein, partial [Burkholderiales bacterium]|nr:YgcG family protein [Burkholderiales bacterium]
MLRLLIALLWSIAALAADVPPLKARVTDLTGTLSAQQRASLEQTLAEFEARKGAQLALLVVPTTQPETIEQYAVRVEEAWKLGRKGVDDSVLLVVAKDDRRLHFEVGYGLEGVLPDAIAKRIIDNDIVPRFREGDFYGGIRAGMDRVMRVVEGEKLPPPAAHGVEHSRTLHPEWLFALFVFVAIGGSVLRAIFGRFPGAGIVGAVAGFVGWALIGSLAIGIIAAL